MLSISSKENKENVFIGKKSLKKANIGSRNYVCMVNETIKSNTKPYLNIKSTVGSHNNSFYSLNHLSEGFVGSKLINSGDTFQAIDANAYFSDLDNDQKMITFKFTHECE